LQHLITATATASSANTWTAKPLLVEAVVTSLRRNFFANKLRGASPLAKPTAHERVTEPVTRARGVQHSQLMDEQSRAPRWRKWAKWSGHLLAVLRD
jgi:hypothetical protein